MNIFILFILAVILSKASGQAWKVIQFLFLEKEYRILCVQDQLLLQKITGVSSQCANDTETWLNSLKLVAGVSNNCLTGKNCTQEEEKIIEDNLYAVERKSFGTVSNLFLKFSSFKKFYIIYFQNTMHGGNSQRAEFFKYPCYGMDLIKNVRGSVARNMRQIIAT